MNTALLSLLFVQSALAGLSYSSSTSSESSLISDAENLAHRAVKAAMRHKSDSSRHKDILSALHSVESKLVSDCLELSSSDGSAHECKAQVKAALGGARDEIRALEPTEAPKDADGGASQLLSDPADFGPQGFYTDFAQGTGDVFDGFIARLYPDSKESWFADPTDATADGKPNVLVVLLDDTGYAQLGPFGSLIPTPNIDKLAANGLTFSNFHTTALCSPSRATILAGRNHHAIGFGSHMLSAMGFPGYSGRVPRSAVGVARHLRDAGYVTQFLGKWDHTPFSETSIAGPFTRWPTGEGFDHFYGFMAADTHNFQSVMWENHRPVEPYEGGDPDDLEEFHVSESMADRFEEFVTGVVSAKQGRKPWMAMYAPGAHHAPHHAPKEYRDRFVGEFDFGWDEARERIFARQQALGLHQAGTKLSERIDEIPAWDSYTADEQRLFARQMEAFAAQVAHTDAQVGRLLEVIERVQQTENTLVILTSDNGASGEGGLTGLQNEINVINGIPGDIEDNQRFYDDWGGPLTYNHYHAGWAMAGNTPYKYFKQSVHRGGQADPLIISYPKGIPEAQRGTIRHQYHHITDIMPTILDVAGVVPDDVVDEIVQQRIDGVSMAYTFDAPDAPTTHGTQYYEMYGSAAIVSDGWKAVTLHGQRMPWNTNVILPFNEDIWELYNLVEDPSETNDLAAEMPDKLLEMQLKFDEEAQQNNVYPLYDDLVTRIGVMFSRTAPKPNDETNKYVYYTPGATRIAEALAPPLKNESFVLEAHLDKVGTEGVIYTTGGMTGGHALYIIDGEVRYTYNTFNKDHYTVATTAPPADNKSTLKVEWTATGNLAGQVKLFIDGSQMGTVDVPFTHPSTWSLEETIDIGRDTGTPVTWDYNCPFTHNGKIANVTVEVIPYDG